MQPAVSKTTRLSVPELLDDPFEFIPRLKIADEQGRLTDFDRPFDEQISALDDFTAPGVETVVHLKPRQIGDTTVATAAMFWMAYTCPDPVKYLIVANDTDATSSIFGRIKLYEESLPRHLRRRLEFSNKKELVFADTKAGIHVLTAGGKGHGRSFTFQGLLLDEFAYWPDPDPVHASLTSTQHDGPYKRTWYLSTPNGPGNLYHRKVLAAMEAHAKGDPSVRFRFFRWADHAKYQKAPAPDWEPSQEEWELAKLHLMRLYPGETEGDRDRRVMRQLFWRWSKINGVDGIGLERFRREYPLTVEDGFLVFEGSWFDVDYLNDLLSTLGSGQQGALRVYRKPKKGRHYAIGADPSWCNGGDNAVAQVLDHAGRQCAVLSMNMGGEHLFAERVANLANVYNNALVLTEANKGGGGSNVISILERDKVNLWKHRDPDSRKLKDWVTHGHGGVGSKQELLGRLRQVVNTDTLDLKDPMTVEEMMHIREVNGKIEGQDGYHDDHVMALALAEWCRRELPTAVVTIRSTRRTFRAQLNPFHESRGGLSIRTVT
jgi:hypothetical protein